MQEFHCPLPTGNVAVLCRSCTAYCPQVVRHCDATVPMPTAPRKCGSALQEHRSLGSDRLLGRTPHPLSWLARALHAFHCPPPPSGVAMHCRNCIAYCPQEVRQCVAGVAPPASERQCGSWLQDFKCPLSWSSVAVHCTTSAAHFPKQCSSALHEFHCPLPPGSEALHCRRSTAHCPRAVW